MTTKEALKIVFSFLKNEPAILATGFISRAAQEVKDRPENFYMIGSMGMVSSVALGIAVSKPVQKVFAIDGDGAVLMNLGTLPLVGVLKPQNFIHIVIDNARYESTGAQPSYTETIRLEDIAKASQYAYTKRAENEKTLETEMEKILKLNTSVFLLVRVHEKSEAASPRIVAEPHEITENLRNSLR